MTATSDTYIKSALAPLVTKAAAVEEAPVPTEGQVPGTLEARLIDLTEVCLILDRRLSEVERVHRSEIDNLRARFNNLVSHIVPGYSGHEL